MTRRLRWLAAGIVLGALGSRRLARVTVPAVGTPARRAVRRFVGDLRIALREGVSAARSPLEGKGP